MDVAKVKKREKRYKYPDLARELKTMEHENDDDTNCNCNHQMCGPETGGLKNKRTNGNHPNYSIAEISQNIDKSPGVLRKLAVT